MDEQKVFKTGIEEVKELLIFGLDLQDAISTSLDDGKITILDAGNFFKPLTSAVTAFGGIQKVKAELLDLDESEKMELMDFARLRFDLPDNELEMLVEDTLEQVFDIYKLSLRWSARRKK